MNKKNLVKIINKELTILADFVEGFNESENIHPMEVDLALSKVKDIYDELLLLKGVIPDKEGIREATIEKPSEMLKKEDADAVAAAEKTHPINIPEPEISGLIPPGSEQSGPIEDEITQIETKNEDSGHLNNKEAELIENNIGDTKKEDQVPEERVPIQEAAKVEKLPEPLLKKNEEQVVDAIQNKNSDEPNTEPVKASAPVVEPEALLTPNTPKEVPQEDEPGKSEIVADKFSKNSPSVNDMMAGIKNNKDLASYLKAGPIADLKKAIKLNDRIWYINELFKKNSATYEKAVDEINAFDNLDEALEYIFTNFKWDQNRKSTISFLELVFRRFATK